MKRATSELGPQKEVAYLLFCLATSTGQNVDMVVLDHTNQQGQSLRCGGTSEGKGSGSLTLWGHHRSLDCDNRKK